MKPPAASDSLRDLRGTQCQAGAALAVSLILLAVLTVLATTSMTVSTLELAMAGNEQYQSQAFYAAEAGISQALAAGPFSMDPAIAAAQFDDPASPDPTPIRGQGTQIAHCADQSSQANDQCEYFMRFDFAAGATPVPGNVDPDSGLHAYHFVVESIGVAGRGAQVELVQGFYVVATAGDPSACATGNATCEITPAGPPVRTYWRQRGAL